jgi:hypothetical protein
VRRIRCSPNGKAECSTHAVVSCYGMQGRRALGNHKVPRLVFVNLLFTTMLATCCKMTTMIPILRHWKYSGMHNSMYNDMYSGIYST